MDNVLPLDKMTTAEKLYTMELLWDDLSRKSGYPESPSWHGDVVALREKNLNDGKERILDWNEAKKEIRGSLE